MPLDSTFPCPTGKTQHKTPVEAYGHMHSLRRKGGHEDRLYRLCVYQCPVCDDWHVGHRANLRRAGRRRLRRLR